MKLFFKNWKSPSVLSRINTVATTTWCAAAWLAWYVENEIPETLLLGNTVVALIETLICIGGCIKQGSCRVKPQEREGVFLFRWGTIASSVYPIICSIKFFSESPIAAGSSIFVAMIALFSVGMVKRTMPAEVTPLLSAVHVARPATSAVSRQPISVQPLIEDCRALLRVQLSDRDQRKVSEWITQLETIQRIQRMPVLQDRNGRKWRLDGGNTLYSDWIDYIKIEKELLALQPEIDDIQAKIPLFLAIALLTNNEPIVRAVIPTQPSLTLHLKTKKPEEIRPTLQTFKDKIQELSTIFIRVLEQDIKENEKNPEKRAQCAQLLTDFQNLKAGFNNASINITDIRKHSVNFLRRWMDLKYPKALDHGARKPPFTTWLRFFRAHTSAVPAPENVYHLTEVYELHYQAEGYIWADSCPFLDAASLVVRFILEPTTNAGMDLIHAENILLLRCVWENYKQTSIFQAAVIANRMPPNYSETTDGAVVGKRPRSKA